MCLSQPQQSAEALQDRIRLLLSPKRYIHSLAVAELAGRWAGLYGLDAERAGLAGLLHDVARDFSDAELLAAAARYGLPVDPVILANPLILHAAVGARLIQGEWGVSDPLILEAVACHTIPEAEMSDFAKLIYLADICEPNRHWWPGRETLVSLAQQDLDQAMAFGIAETMAYLEEKGQTPHPHTLGVLEHFRQKAADKGRNSAFNQ